MSANVETEIRDKARAVVAQLSEGGTLMNLMGATKEQMEAIYAVAHNYVAAKKYDKGIDLLRFLCMYDHTEPRWFYGLGVALQLKGDYGTALNAYGVCTLLDIDDPRPQAQAGYCLMAMDKLPEARSAFEGAFIACAGKDEDLQSQIKSMLDAVDAREDGGKSGEGKA